MENNDANTNMDGQGSSPETGEETVELTPIVDEEGLVGTMEFDRVEPSVEDDQPEGDDPSGDAEQNASGTQDTQKPTTPYHEDPRWQEIISDRNAEREGRIAAEKELEVYKRQGGPAKEQNTQVNRFEGKSDEDLLNDFTTNPKGFLADFANAVISGMQEKTAAEKAADEQRSFQERQDATFREFFKDKEVELRELAPQIKEYIQKNPGHNAISAYQELTRDKRTETMRETIRNEEREKLLKEFKAGYNAQSASTGNPPGGAPSSRGDHRLKNPEKYGGSENVLLARFKEREAAQ